MVWASHSITERMKFLICGGNLNEERCQCGVLQQVAPPYVHSLGLNSTLQDDNAGTHRASSLRDGEDGAVCQQPWPPSAEACCRVGVTDTTTFTGLWRMPVEERDVIPQQCVTRRMTSMRRSCQAVCGSLHTLLKPLSVQWTSCLKLESSDPPNPTHKSSGRENCKRRFAARPTNACSLETWQHSQRVINRLSNNRRVFAKKC